jgi:hypothetical protein
MKSLRVLVVLWLLGGLLLGCSSGAHSAAGRPAYLAQAVFVDCKNSMECCIKKFPATAMESCGATATEAAEVLNGGKMVNVAPATVTLKGVDEPEREEDGDGREEMPEWRQHCIDQYTRCVDLSWTGNCHACHERCRGQRGEWPKEMCGPPKGRSRR